MFIAWRSAILPDMLQLYGVDVEADQVQDGKPWSWTYALIWGLLDSAESRFRAVVMKEATA